MKNICKTILGILVIFSFDDHFNGEYFWSFQEVCIPWDFNSFENIWPKPDDGLDEDVTNERVDQDRKGASGTYPIRVMGEGFRCHLIMCCCLPHPAS